MYVIKFILRKASGDVIKQKKHKYTTKERAQFACDKLNEQYKDKSPYPYEYRNDLYWVEEE